MSGKSAKRNSKTIPRSPNPESLVNAPIAALEALKIQEILVAWTQSAGILRHYTEDIQDSVPSTTLSFEEARRSAEFQLVTWRKSLMSVAPIFCETGFSSLAATMTATAPRESVRAEDLIAKDGLLVFEAPITIEPTTDSQTAWDNCRSIAWKTVQNGDESVLIINAWVDVDAGPRAGGRVLQGLTGHETTYIVEGELRRDDQTLVRLLRSVTALTRSELSGAEALRLQSSAGSSFVRSAKQTAVRRVYLHSPDHAEFEADALAAEKAGRAPMRLHWVRGHWRRQWYAASELHKWKWIDGFLKGNADSGTMTGPRLMIAKDGAAD